MKRSLLVFLGAFLSLGFNAVKSPDTEEPVRWSTPSVTMAIQQNGSDNVSDGSDIAAIRAALGAWSNACSSFSFTEGGLVSDRSASRDGVNKIVFAESSFPGGGSGAATVVNRARDESGDPHVWIEADIVVNGVNYDWSTKGSVHHHDIQSVVTHELGHVLGLQHASDPESTMYTATGRGLTHARTLHPDDIAGLCYLYPSGAFSCSSDADCPLLHAAYGGGGNVRMHCDNNACVSGSVPYGYECTTSGHCSSSICLADPDASSGQDPGFCSEQCSPVGSPCTSGGYCSDVGGSARCYFGRDDCLIDDHCPGRNNVCAVQLNGRLSCQMLCLEDGHCNTGSGEVCHGGTGANPPGFCRTPGSTPEGTTCDSALDCQSLFCSGGASSSCVGAPRVPVPDGGVPVPDSGSVVPDSGVAPPDSGVAPPDSGIPPADTGPRPDTGPQPDTGLPPIDGGVGNGEEEAVGGGCNCSSNRSQVRQVSFLNFFSRRS